jgi:hypothetical protein
MAGFRSLKTTALFEARYNQSIKNYPCSSIVMVKAGNFYLFELRDVGKK